MTTREITGLEFAIGYADGLAGYCRVMREQVGAVVPIGQEPAASCEQARAGLVGNGVTGRALAGMDLGAEADDRRRGCGAGRAGGVRGHRRVAAVALQAELERQRAVQEAYAATPDAGTKEFVIESSCPRRGT